MINHGILAPNFHHGTVVLHVVQLFHRRLHGGGVREVREGVAFGGLGVLGPIRCRGRMSVKSKDVKIRIFKKPIKSEPTNTSSVRKIFI